MGDDECCLKLWNYESGKAEKVYRGHTNAKYCLLGSFFTHGDKGPLIVNGSEDGSILFWDVTSQRIVQRISGSASGAGEAADLGPAEDEPAQPAREDGDEAGNKAEPAVDAGHNNVVLTTACHPIKPWVASGELGDGATIKIWVRNL
jgi:WD40 repeat protein